MAIRVWFIIVISVSAYLASANRSASASPEAPPRIADARSMHCTRVQIRLPDEILFVDSSGEVLRAHVTTNLTAGQYKLRYAADEQRLRVAPWKDTNAVVTVSLSGPESTGEQYQSCLRSMSRGVPLTVVGASGSAVARMSFDEARAVLDAAGGQTHDQTWADISRGLARDTRPLSAANMRQTIDAHSKRPGIANAPATSTRAVITDLAAKSDAWHALKKWERQLWRDFIDEYGDSTDVSDPATADQLTVTADTRLSMALRIAPRYMSEGARDAARELFNDPVFATTAVLGISAYLALWLAPEPLFTKATAVLTTVGLVATAGFTASEIIALARAWDQLRRDTRHAHSLGAMERAAERFGKSIGGSGLRILLALATFAGARHVAKTGPAGGSVSAPVVAGQSGGAAVAAVPVAGGIGIQVTADGAVVLVHGSMTAHAVANGPGGGGAGNRSSAVTKPASGMDALRKAGQVPDRGGLTKAGRALAKHGGREGSAFPKPTGDPAAINKQAQIILDDILGNVSSTKPNRFGGTDYIGPKGRGARYDSEGNFMGFLEP